MAIMLHRNNPRTTGTVFFVFICLSPSLLRRRTLRVVSWMSLEDEMKRLRNDVFIHPCLADHEYIAAFAEMRIVRYKSGKDGC